MSEVILDTLRDVERLLPFLFATYLVMEWLEHKTGEKTEALIKRAGRFGPVIGGALGIVPQCGFSAAASNLYAGRVITLGTLLAVYLSTSDEMLPVFLSERASGRVIFGFLLAKAGIGMIAGLAIDFLSARGRRSPGEHIHDICSREHCHCERGVLRSALRHTAQIALFLLLITFGLNLLFYFTGDGLLTVPLLNGPLTGPLLSGLVGLLPNCAGSVVITQLYLEGVIGVGTAMAGLLTGSGVGLLVLFRVNRQRKENIRILGLLYGIGVFAGVVAGIFF
ncbi:MAG: arsenic efflux protein [Roseburia sp.]|nr:arsenic efflux protein [Roseburia sp.]MCM1096611.1 arsenic efflux protein [Ruminococcus flavefaciens]